MQALALVSLVLLAGQGADAARVTEAQQAEERAFAAVEEKRWCDASRLFLEANGHAPSVDLVFNAAQAAALAGDRKQAMKLYADLLGAYPESKRQQAVNGAIGELTKQIAEQGPGAPCPEPKPEPEPEPAVETPAPDDGRALWPWLAAGGGAALAAGGGAMIGIGLTPYLSHASVAAEIREAEKARADASGLQREQASAREAWESWGELTLWSGVVTTTVGLAIAATGLVLGAWSPEPTEETESP